MLTWSAIIPLIGGMPLSMHKVFGTMPEYVLSWSAFQWNDQHFVNYIRNNGWSGKYYVLDGEEKSVIPDITTDLTDIPHVDVVCGTPPCAGLSSLSRASNADSPINDWMVKATEFVLEHIQPKIYWFENAPRLGSKSGTKVADKIRNIGKKNGYTFLIYTTQSRYHGNPQIRPRTFGFLFNTKYFGPHIRKLRDIPFSVGTLENWMTKIDDWVDKNTDGTSQMDMPINLQNPADSPYYQFCYEHVKAANHRDFIEKICGFEKSVNLLEQTCEFENYNYPVLIDWFQKHNAPVAEKKMKLMKENADAGKGNWTHGITVGRGTIPAFIGVMPYSLVHPFKQSYVTFREGLHLMGFPEDFTLVGNPWKSTNCICQNVPVGTAADMVKEIQNWIEHPKENVVNTTYAVQRHLQGDIQDRDSHVSSCNLENFF